MPRVSVGPDAITKPTRYRADHGTMTLAAESSVPTMQITMAGAPPVFLQNGEFYDQNGDPYDFDRLPEGEDGLRQHIVKTANKKILAMHGFLVDEPDPENGKKADEPPMDRETARKKEMLSHFAPVDSSGDGDMILGIIGDGEVTYDAISKASGLAPHRLQLAMSKIGTELERIGEGKKGSPYLYRRAMPA